MINLRLNLGFFSILVFASVFTSSCKQKQRDSYEGEKEILVSAVEKTKVSDKFSWVVVLPGLGCPGCIQEGEVFVKDHFKNGNIFFVLTKVSSVKILQQKIGFKVQGEPNVFIDADNIYDVPTDNRIYPIIIRVEHGKLLSYEFQCPKNSEAFDKLNRLVAQSK